MLNLKIGKQFPDSENVQRHLEIAQIPGLCGTYIWLVGTAILNSKHSPLSLPLQSFCNKTYKYS